MEIPTKVRTTSANPILINVGGTIHSTTLATLTKYPNSKLGMFFNGVLTIPVDEGNKHYFFDLNGSVFCHILDFLRYGELVLPDDFNQLHLLKKQAEYFELDDMVNMLAFLPKKNENKLEERPVTGLMSDTKAVEAMAGAVAKMSTGRVDVAVVRYKMRPMSSGCIDIYSLDRPRLREPTPETPRMRLKPFLGFCTHIMYDVPSSGSTELILPYALHFVGQFLDIGYRLCNVVNTSNEHRNSKSLEFILTLA